MIVADRTETDEAATEARIKRQELRDRIAKRKLLERRHGELTDEMSRVSQAFDERVGQHAEVLQPLKVELAEIERQQIKRLADRQPEDEALAKRQREILATVRERESELALAAAARDNMLVALQHERREVGMESSKLPDEHSLCETAPEHLQVEHAVAMSSARWAETRIRAAFDRLERRGDSKLLRAEIAAAEKAHEVARRYADECYRKLIDAE